MKLSLTRLPVTAAPESAGGGVIASVPELDTRAGAWMVAPSVSESAASYWTPSEPEGET